MAKVAKIFDALFTAEKLMHYFFLQKMGWSTFWATFSQTHPVALITTSAGISSTLQSKKNKKRLGDLLTGAVMVTFIESISIPV
jgi:hypothetical protein